MANSLGAVFRSMWHTMTSYDRHATIDSPYRTGRHVPLNREGALTSVASASESRADISFDERASAAILDTSYGGSGLGADMPLSPGSRAYSPGLRSLNAQRSNNSDGFETHSPSGEIPMQSFQDGLPPAPPVSHTWSRIDAWAEDNYPELFDQLCEPCTVNDLNELEHQLDCTLPQDVRDSLQVHDGQERGGLPTGIIFSGMLLDCEEIVQEWENWRKVNQEFLIDTAISKPSMPSKAFGGSSSQASSSKDAPSSPTPSQNVHWRQELLAKQDCVPPQAIQKTYAHPAWIPLVRDWGGNNIAIDLAPGPKGHWGQVIIFGRDYDTKYVIARSWAHFLAQVADDLNSGKWFVDEDTNELKLREFKKARVEPSYFDIMRWRMDQKFGRRGPSKRKTLAPDATSPTSVGSPHADPVEPAGEARGRPLHRLNSGSSPLASPIRPGYGKSSPLARVAEETALTPLGLAIPNGPSEKDKLVEVETPRVSGEDNKRLSAVANGDTGDKAALEAKLDSNKLNGKQPATGLENTALEDTMKTIEI